MEQATTGGTDDPRYGGVRLLAPQDAGRYPFGSTLLISGTESSVLIDPSLEVQRRGGAPDPVDVVLVSHGHEDHVAGLSRLPDVPVRVHPADAPAVRDPAALLDAYGVSGAQREQLTTAIVDTFQLTERDDVGALADGDVLDLGGRTVTVVHLPGHTAGHCGFLVEPDGFLFLGDIDLTSFGPYYGDRSSSLEEFQASIERCREIDAKWYGTSHQKGVIQGRDQFLAELGAYADVITRRDERLLALLTEPRALDDVVAHRLVYRPHVQLPHVEAVERRTAQLHLERLERQGRVSQTPDGWARTA